MNRFVNISGKIINRDFIHSVETSISCLEKDIIISEESSSAVCTLTVNKIINYPNGKIDDFYDKIKIKVNGEFGGRNSKYKNILEELGKVYREVYEPKIIKKVLEEIYEDK